MSKYLRILLTISLVSVTFPLVPPQEVSADATTALLAHWRMDETSWNGTSGEVVDSSGNDLNATGNNSITTSAGRIRNSGEFNGSSEFISLADPGTDSILDFSNAEEINLSAWINPDNVSGFKTILTKGRTSGTNESNYGIRLSGAQLQFVYIDSTVTTFHVYGNSSGTISANNWHHVSFSYIFGTPSSAAMYIDGSLVSGSWISGTGNAIPRESNEPLHIGQLTSSEYFDGQIDDVRIYSRSLTASDVLEVKEQAVDINNGQMGYWKFDEDSYSDTSNEVIDSSGNARHGTPAGGMTTITTGKVNNAADMDGSDDYISVPTFNPPNNFSYGGWFNPGNSWPGDGRLIDKWNNTSPNRGWMLTYVTIANEAKCRVSDDGTNFASATAIVPLDQWSHLMCVREDKNISIYLNGALVETVTTSTAATYNSSNPITFGRQNTGSIYSNSSADEIRIYDRALVPAEVTAIVAAGNDLSSDLVGYWKMDESSWSGASGEVKDLSGNGNDGTAISGATTTTGFYNNAADFDGVNDYVNITDDPAISNFDKAFTVSAWMSTEVLGSRDKFIAKGNNPGTATQYEYVLDKQTDDTMRMVITDGSTQPTVESTTTMEVDTWYHVVGTYDGRNMRIYINGVLEGTTAFTQDMRDDSGPLQFGRENDSGSGNDFVQGQLDDVRIFSRPLNPQEVALLYRINPTVTTSNKQLSDQMDRINESTESGHLIQFVTEQGIAAGTTIEVNFPSTTFTFGGSYDYTDMTLSQGTTGDCDTATFNDKTLSSVPSGATWGAAYASDTVTFTSGTDVIPVDTCVQIDLDTNGGAHAITNPGVTGNTAYQIEVVASGDTHTGAIIIVETGSEGDEIILNAEINSTLAFDIDVSVLNCENSTETSASANTIDFGNLFTILYKSSDAAINFVCIDIVSNAANGVDVFVQSSNASSVGAMDSGSGQIVSATADLNVISGPGYGARVQSVGTPSEGTLTPSSPFDSGSVGDVGLIPGTSASPASLVSSTGPVATAAASRIAIEVSVKADPTVGAGQYFDVLTFTATASF